MEKIYLFIIVKLNAQKIKEKLANHKIKCYNIQRFASH